MKRLNQRQPLHLRGKEQDFDEHGFLNKLKRFALRLGKPAVEKMYALYYLVKAPTTPKRAKMIIIGALIYFISPIDALPDLLGPLGFTDDLAVIGMVYAQFKSYMTIDIKTRAKAATEQLFKKC